MSTESERWKGPRGRGRRLIGPLRLAGGGAFILAALALVLPAPGNAIVGTALVAGLVAAPFARVAFLVYRWWQLGDHRYATVAAALLVVMGTGALVAFIR